MNKFQKNYHRQQSRLAAGAYLAPAECIGKEFPFGSCMYLVIEHHEDRWTFTLQILNQGNARIEKDETFVRHHCTPPQPREAREIPCRPDVPRYFPLSNPIISDKTDIGATVAECPVGDKMTDTELTDVQLNTTLDAIVAAPDPAYYLDQEFDFEVDGTTYHAKVQAWNERRQQFRLYAPGGAPWYREPAFVYEYCQPAAAPVIREPLPEIKFDPRRFWNLLSLSDKRKYIAEDVQATGVPQPDPLRTCGCCGQPLMIIGAQTFPPKYNLKNHIMVECQNPGCLVHRRTSSTESHHQICADARKEQAQYAHARSQYWMGELQQLRDSGKGQHKAALKAQRKSQYWLNQLKKLEASVNG